MENPYERMLTEFKELGKKLDNICDRLDKLEGNDNNVILGMHEAADFLRISTQTLYGLVSKREI